MWRGHRNQILLSRMVRAVSDSRLERGLRSGNEKCSGSQQEESWISRCFRGAGVGLNAWAWLGKNPLGGEGYWSAVSCM